MFHEAAALEPDARALARRFQDLSVAPDPLTLLWDEPNLRGPLLALARARGAARLGVTLDAGVGGRSGPAWSQLSDKDQRTIRALAGHLARYHSSLVPVSRPRQAIIDTALFGLAEIFARNDGFAGDVMDLPHAAGSRFIGFCRSVLRDHVHPTHCSPTALARRWQRLKRLQQDGLRPSSRRR